MKNFYETPLLIGDGDNGKKQWQGFAARGDDGTVVIYAKYGSVGKTIVTSAPTTITAKNVGRANETSLEDQARSEIDAKCTKKQKEGYMPQGQAVAPEIQRVQKRVLPMLAPTDCYPKLAKHLSWPLYIQPKFDGVRGVTDGADFWSRKGELFPLEHLRHDTKGLLVDGELLLPWDKFSFQQTLSAVKNVRNPNHKDVFFVVFDVVDTKRPFEERFALLRQFMAENPHPMWVLSTTQEIATPEEATTFYEACIEQGLEGAMLRTKTGIYDPGGRYRGLQKYKPTDDQEFEIVGFREAEGGWAGTPVLEMVVGAPCTLCVAQGSDHDGEHDGQQPGFDGKFGKAGTRFDAKPRMDFESACRLFQQCKAGKVVGKMTATVLFQSFYDQKPGDPKAGKPRFPRVKALRDN